MLPVPVPAKAASARNKHGELERYLDGPAARRVRLRGPDCVPLGIPGVEPGPLTRAVPFVGLFAWLLLLANRGSPGASDPLPAARAWLDGWPCVGRMLGLALTPSLVIILLLRNAAPHQRRWAGLFALLSSNALAILGTQMVCMKDGPSTSFPGMSGQSRSPRWWAPSRAGCF